MLISLAQSLICSDGLLWPWSSESLLRISFLLLSSVPALWECVEPFTSDQRKLQEKVGIGSARSVCQKGQLVRCHFPHPRPQTTSPSLASRLS